MNHPDYYHLRSELIGFLQQQRRLKQRKQRIAPVVPAAKPDLETVRLGYLPGLDIAPLAVAMERGFLSDRGIELRPVAFDRWQTLEDELRKGELDVAITSATTPLALTLGLDGQAAWPAITPMTVTRSGNALCLARRFSDLGIHNLSSLAERLKGREWPLRLAVAQKGNMQELLLRHWLASGGIDPDREVELLALSPMAMEATLRAGEIDGFIAGRYRVAKAVEAGLTTVLATDLDIWGGHPEKVLTCHENWALNHQEALLNLCAALMRGGQICEDPAEHDQLVSLLGAAQWLGTGSALALQRQFDLGTDEPSGVRLPLNRFHSDRAHLANAAEGSWILTQFSRWGWSAFPSNRLELLSQVYRSDLCSRALERAGFADLRPERQPFVLADGVAFDQDNPLDYLKQQPYCRTTALESIPLPTGSSPRPIAAH
jgi:nitrate/nitrite transport system ATP-binding protein